MAEQTHAEETLRDLVSRLGFGDGVSHELGLLAEAVEGW